MNLSSTSRVQDLNKIIQDAIKKYPINNSPKAAGNMVTGAADIVSKLVNGAWSPIGNQINTQQMLDALAGQTGINGQLARLGVASALQPTAFEATHTANNTQGD